MKADLKHLLDLPSEGYLNVTFGKNCTLNSGRTISLDGQEYLYTLLVEDDIAELARADNRNIQTDVNLIRVPRVKVSKVLVQGEPYSIDITIVFNRKELTYRIKGCLRNKL